MVSQIHEQASHGLVLDPSQNAEARNEDQRSTTLSPVADASLHPSPASTRKSLHGAAELRADRHEGTGGKQSNEALEICQCPPVSESERLNPRAEEVNMSLESATIKPPTSAEGSPQQWSVGLQQQQPKGLQSPVGNKAVPNETSVTLDAKPLLVAVKPRQQFRWIRANCLPLAVPNHSASPDSHQVQAMSSDHNGVLLLVAEDTGSPSLLRLFCTPDSMNVVEAAGRDTLRKQCPCTCKTLTVVGDLPITKFYMGEVALVQINGETVLLMTEQQEREEQRPARLAVYSLTTLKRECTDASTGAKAVSDERLESVSSQVSTWSLSRDESSPEARSFYTVVADKEKHALILFGGSKLSQQHIDSDAVKGSDQSLHPTWHPLDELWSFSMFSCRWDQRFRDQQISIESSADQNEEKQIFSSPWPDAVAGHSAATWGRGMWIFGGCTCPSTNAEVKAVATNDVWRFSLNKGRWRHITSLGAAPCPRYRHASCIIGRNLLIFGGMGAEGLVSGEEMMYAADIINHKTVTWTRVSLLDSLPPTEFYLGAPLHYGQKSTTGVDNLFIYGGRKAYVVSAKGLEDIAKNSSAEDCACPQKNQKIEAEDVQKGNKKTTQLLRENVLIEAVKVAQRFVLSSESSSSATEVQVHEEKRTNEKEAPLRCGPGGASSEPANGKRSVSKEPPIIRGMKILATIMPGSEKQGQEAGGVMHSSSTAGKLPQPREPNKHSFDEGKAPAWRAAFPLQSTPAPIIFRARCRARRSVSRSQWKASSNYQRHEADPDPSSTTPGLNSHCLAQTPSDIRETRGAVNQRGHGWPKPPPNEFKTGGSQLKGNNNSAAREAVSIPKSSYTVPSSIIQSPPFSAVSSISSPKSFFSDHQLSILLSLSHQATFGVAKPLLGAGAASGTRRGPTLSSDHYHRSSAVPLQVVPQNVSQVADLAAVLPAKPPTHPAPSQVSCRQKSEISTMLSQEALASSFEGLQGDSEWPKDRENCTRLVKNRHVEPAAVGEAEEKRRPQFCPLGSFAFKLPSCPPASSPPTGIGIPGSKRCFDGADALMWWAASMNKLRVPQAYAKSGGSSTSHRSQSCFSSSTDDCLRGWSHDETTQSRVSVTNNNWGSNGDAVLLDKASTPTPARFGSSPWSICSQQRARYLAGMFYASQLTDAADEGSAPKEPLPPLPEQMNTVGLRSTPKSLVARRISPFAFAAQSARGEADWGLPLPRSSRKVKARTSNLSQTRSNVKSTSKPEGAAKLKPTKAQSYKPTPRQLPHRHSQRLHRTPSATPRPARTRSIATQKNASVSNDRALGIHHKRQVNRRGTGEQNSGSSLRQTSTRSQRGRNPRLSSVLGLHEAAHERLLRRMVGWPGEAIASVLLGRVAKLTEPILKPRTGSVRARSSVNR